jgi:hypothetical protein
VLATVDLSTPAEFAWQNRVILLMERIRIAVAAHPFALPLFVAHRHAAAASLRWIEAMLSVLADAGFAGNEVQWRSGRSSVICSARCNLST